MITRKENFNFEIKQKQSSERFLDITNPVIPHTGQLRYQWLYISHNYSAELHFIFRFIFITILWNFLEYCENMSFYSNNSLVPLRNELCNFTGQYENVHWGWYNATVWDLYIYNALCRELSGIWAKKASGWDHSHLSTATTSRQNDTRSTSINI